MKTVFLDFDGTIVDVMPRFHAIFSEYLSILGMTALSLLEYRRLKHLHSYDPEIFKALGVEIDWEDYRKWKTERVEAEPYLRLDRPIGDPHRVVSALKDRGYFVVLLSARRFEDRLLEELDWLGISDVFDDVLATGSYDVRSKAKMLAKIAGNDDVIVGDSESELTVAKELGLKHFGVATGLRSPDFLFENGARVVLRDYTVLPDLLV